MSIDADESQILFPAPEQLMRAREIMLAREQSAPVKVADPARPPADADSDEEEHDLKAWPHADALLVDIAQLPTAAPLTVNSSPWSTRSLGSAKGDAPNGKIESGLASTPFDWSDAAPTLKLRMAPALPSLVPSTLGRLRDSTSAAMAAVARVLPSRLTHQARVRRARGRAHPRRRKILISLASVFLLVSVLATQLNGAFGAWLADEMRALLGPAATAQIESWFLGVEDGIHKLQYSITGASDTPPWTPPPASTTTVPVILPQQVHEMPLPPMDPLITPPLDGEGVWSTAGLPPPAPNQPPLVARAFIRPDPSRPYAIVTLLQFDLRYLSLHVVAGASEPGGPLGNTGPGVIPGDVQIGDTLFAAFNGGFKYADGHYGLMADGKVYVPPQNGAATIAITNKGQVLLDEWGRNPALSVSNKNLVAWRQNAALLIDNGNLNPLTKDGAAWGGVYLNQAATWRSALGVTASGTLLYAAGDSLTAATLGKALQAAGAVSAMQTDINPAWVRAFLYQRDASGALQIIKLHPGMQGTGKEYLQHDERDFFYITRAVQSDQHAPKSG